MRCKPKNWYDELEYGRHVVRRRRRRRWVPAPVTHAAMDHAAMFTKHKSCMGLYYFYPYMRFCSYSYGAPLGGP